MNKTLYPVYHTVHDTFYLQKTFSDPNLKAHVMVYQFSAIIVLEAAVIPLLPFNLVELGWTWALMAAGHFLVLLGVMQF